MENQKEAEIVMTAVGVVLLVAGAKHGLANLVEQWRALVFLCLNLLLLTIVFTSVRSNKTETQVGNGGNKKEKKTVNNKKLKSSSNSSWPVQVEDIFFDAEEEKVLEVAPDVEKEEAVQVEVEVEVEVEVDDDTEVDEGQHVSKEELNARVESFIMMFRHQLALDAQEKKSRHAFSPVMSKGSPVTVR